jgi:hypothetical protein
MAGHVERRLAQALDVRAHRPSRGHRAEDEAFGVGDPPGLRRDVEVAREQAPDQGSRDRESAAIGVEPEP